MLTKGICLRNSNHSPTFSCCIFEDLHFTSTFGQTGWIETVPLQVKDKLAKIQGCTGLNSQFEKVKMENTHCNFLKKPPKKGCFFQLHSVDFSAPPVHSAFAQNSIFLNPVTFSCFDNKRITTPDFLKGQEVEVSQVVAWQVKVLPHPSVPVVVHSPPVLCASDSTVYVGTVGPTRACRVRCTVKLRYTA